MLSASTTANISPLLERKIEEISAGIPASYSLHLRSSGPNNVKVIVDYILTMKSEVNLSDHYRRDLIEVLSKFSKHSNNRPFKDLTRNDVVAFLDTYRRLETQDPLHKWIGTYNIYRIHLLCFFKWLYYPDLEPNKRSNPQLWKISPSSRERRNQSIHHLTYGPQQDDLLFLKYCPSKREKCYHAISRDLSCRPHEIVKLKIRDLSFKAVGSSQYCEVVVNGKTGTRSIPLINSIPYLKDYLDHEHPQPTNPNSHSNMRDW